jgi:hypothetical protein
MVFDSDASILYYEKAAEALQHMNMETSSD